jgi:hypothetical protein
VVYTLNILIPKQTANNHPMKKNIYKKPTIGLLCIKVMFLCGSKNASLSPGTERGDASQADAKRAVDFDIYENNDM